MAGASESKLYRVFQVAACLIGALLMVTGLLLPARHFVGYGSVILIHGLVATLMIWLDARREQNRSGGA